ncbi:MAG TPA: 2'-deoxycytidine 5'-triphosphate deaminase [Acidimicrobiia bacterium]|nr:2'-deoxycytidine 5'-triphosphate deaminase [Acidimicrobiia bacterium]
MEQPSSLAANLVGGPGGPLGLGPDPRGVLASQHLRRAIDAGVIDAGPYKILPASVQPASLDLHLGEVAYRIRASFLPDASSVEVKLKDFIIDEVDLRRDGAILETKRPYLIPLIEELDLPDAIRGKANPKSSTGRLDVFTRVITDNSHRFDEVAPGYRGKLFLEVVPLSFTVKVRQGLALNQLRLLAGSALLTDGEIRALHSREPILARGGTPLPDRALSTADGLFLGLDLRGDEARGVGYRAKDHTQVLEMSREDYFDPDVYWEPVRSEPGDRIVLAPDRFYLLLSDESVRIPPGYAAEMTAYDPTSGELRTHYAGFFDPGFGYDPEGRFLGSRAALEVRAHDVPFMIENGQKVCKLTFERMIEEPDVLYGSDIGSSYQTQVDTLSKHFRRRVPPRSEPPPTVPGELPGLFEGSGT